MHAGYVCVRVWIRVEEMQSNFFCIVFAYVEKVNTSISAITVIIYRLTVRFIVTFMSVFVFRLMYI